MYLTLPDVYCPRLMTMDRDGNGNLKEGAIQDAISKRVELSQKSILNGSRVPRR